MKNKIKFIFGLLIISIIFANCKSDSDSFADTIFNFQTTHPYVSIVDLNEEIVFSATGNSFWSGTLTAENEGNQVRIIFESQDPNIVSHDIIIGRDAANSPPDDGVLLRTITTFPTVIIITKQDLATALNEPIENFNSGIIRFGGISTDADGNVLQSSDDLELFLTFERNAYEYNWNLN